MLAKKIRIGYVLKSADVGTLFSGRNSENSSHTHVQTRPHLPIPAHTHAPPCPPVPSRAHQHTSVHAYALLAHTPHIPTDAR